MTSPSAEVMQSGITSSLGPASEPPTKMAVFDTDDTLLDTTTNAGLQSVWIV